VDSRGGAKNIGPWIVDLDYNQRMAFVPIKPGRYKMGSNNLEIREMPVRNVTITQPFWMANTVVTRAQFLSIMGFDPLEKFDNVKNSFPVSVGRPVAYEFCAKLTELEKAAGNLPLGYEITLPSEAQWEYACRAGSEVDIQTNLNEYVWDYDLYPERYPGIPLPVAQKQPNAWGLYDMPGRLLEWCSDCAHSNYLGAPTDESVWGSGRAAKCRGMVRGGIFRVGAQPQPATRTMMYVDDTCGFRPIIQPIRGQGSRLNIQH
jgi:formylglycine-generating enzyme required for sulfatase activity